jgi:hypothetical protein
VKGEHEALLRLEYMIAIHQTPRVRSGGF